MPAQIDQQKSFFSAWTTFNHSRFLLYILSTSYTQFFTKNPYLQFIAQYIMFLFATLIHLFSTISEQAAKTSIIATLENSFSWTVFKVEKRAQNHDFPRCIL